MASPSQIYNAPIPSDLPPNSVVAVIRQGCSLCANFLERSHYPTVTQDGRPITYINDARPDGANYYRNVLAAHVQGSPSLPVIFSVGGDGSITEVASGPDAAVKAVSPHPAAAREAGRALAGCSLDPNALHDGAPLPSRPAGPDNCHVKGR